MRGSSDDDWHPPPRPADRPGDHHTHRARTPLVQEKPPLTAFAAASLKNALDDAGKGWTAATGEAARFSYAASSAIARQVEAGAPADVFISADSDWMDYLAKRGLILAASRVDLLSNPRALIAPADSKLPIRIGKAMPLGRAIGNGRLAVAGPDVPAGG